jgi:site-specific DNA recombinase
MSIGSSWIMFLTGWGISTSLKLIVSWFQRISERERGIAVMKVAAIYARVSSERQRDEETIASQTAALKEFAATLDLEVPSEWVFEDEGFSGATLVRPCLEKLRDLVAQVPVDVVLVYTPDRLARKYAYQALIIEELGRAGTAVRFLKGPKADTPEDELLLQFQGMIAEYERAQIAERTRRGKAHRARNRGTRCHPLHSCNPHLKVVFAAT